MSRQTAALGRFTADLRAFQVQLAQHMDELVQNIAFEIAENIIVGGKYAPGTPVDTNFARSSWWVSIGEMGEGHQPADNPLKLPPAGPADTSKVASAKAGDNVWIMTNTVYMIALEYGHSTQAPQGMVRLTLNAGQELVDDIARQMGARF